jgi:SNF2 family DNA or RNA helicase
LAIELTESFFAEAAGWEAMKHARSLLAAGKVLSSNWTEPVLRGVVQEGTISYRAGLVIKSQRDIENICTCRTAREWGTICAHSVAVGLRHLQQTAKPVEAAGVSPAGKTAAAARPKPGGKRVRRPAAGEEGEPAEVFVIFPTNLPAAVERGKVMLCFEGAWRGGRGPLNALPPARPFRFSSSDTALLDRIETLAGGETPALLMLGAHDLADLLPLLAGHPRLVQGRSNPITVAKTPWRPVLKAQLEPDGEIVLSFRQPGQAPALIEKTWVFHDDLFQPLTLPPSFAALFNGPIRLRRLQVPEFLSRDWPQLEAQPGVEANFRLEDFELQPQRPRLLLHLTGGLAQLQAHLQCQYGPRLITLGLTAPDESLWLPDPVSPLRYSTRDTPAERAAVARLLRAGFTGPDSQGRYRLLGQDRVLGFLARDYPRLRQEWEVTLEERLERSTAQNLERIEPRFEVTSSGMQWFDLSVSFASASGQTFSAAEIQRLILSGQGHTRLPNGRTALLETDAVEELQEVLLDCAPDQHEGGYRMAHTQAGFIEATLREKGWAIQSPADWRQRAAQQSGEARLECPPLGRLDTVLRPYQKQGVAWLHFLRAHGFGGILADEMGLGKTLQVLALVKSRTGILPVLDQPKTETGVPPAPKGNQPKDGGRQDACPTLPQGDRQDACPTLVICPTSLVFNWVNEARKFTPELRVLALQGPDRQALFPQIAKHDLVVTSYALVRRDLEQYRPFEFDTVVLDEAQHIKNRQTQNAQAVKAVRARHRLVLTGTPLENSVLDLWSIFDFLMPGYLGSAQDFRERYEAPITRAHDEATAARLARRLRPFLLRRLKRVVAPELPPKLEQVAYCELTDDQRAVYQQIMEAGRKEMLAAAGQEKARGRIAALNALLRLRQVCCDLRLLKLAASEETTALKSETPNPDLPSSGKLDLFSELLEEVLDGGHRVLVFSQFVSMLTLLRERLADEGVEYCYLDGSTVDREQVVNRFQTSATPVFLISLKAGGVGLNLSGADTVIHFDPWWNPAVEDQATDRAHRIGQTRLVTSYKLIARGTVEEKILQLQQRKRELIRATVDGEQSFVDALTWEEIQELFC